MILKVINNSILLSSYLQCFVLLLFFLVSLPVMCLLRLHATILPYSLSNSHMASISSAATQASANADTDRYCRSSYKTSGGRRRKHPIMSQLLQGSCWVQVEETSKSHKDTHSQKITRNLQSCFQEASFIFYFFYPLFSFPFPIFFQKKGSKKGNSHNLPAMRQQC